MTMPGRRRVFLLTGVPGVGKTTIGRMLAELIGGIHVDLSGLAIAKGLIAGYDEARGTSIVDVAGMRAELAEMMGSGEEALIVDGHYAPEVVPPEAVSFAFVLRRAPWILKEELRARGFPAEKVRENVEAELLDICLVDAIGALGPGRVCEVDTTDRTPREVVDEVASIISGGEPCRHGLVDWLGCPQARALL
jgi:adenylate kinase